ncbi:unnamed protein product [Microthlaspi erraticum]|uniref:Uncharacterized protein n=1 Tax=Microthlaspi erraticum TaxID=1685480 RepID=A0A6D2I0E2_9BRAS|nr:unnamed protein product [Microthlaspi erraticum]
MEDLIPQSRANVRPEHSTKLIRPADPDVRTSLKSLVKPDSHHSCYGCGSPKHCVLSSPKRDAAPRVCYYYKEPGHIKLMCLKLRSMLVASVQTIDVMRDQVLPIPITDSASAHVRCSNGLSYTRSR